MQHCSLQLNTRGRPSTHHYPGSSTVKDVLFLELFVRVVKQWLHQLFLVQVMDAKCLPVSAEYTFGTIVVMEVYTAVAMPETESTYIFARTPKFPAMLSLCVVINDYAPRVPDIIWLSSHNASFATGISTRYMYGPQFLFSKEVFIRAAIPSIPGPGMALPVQWSQASRTTVPDDDNDKTDCSCASLASAAVSSSSFCKLKRKTLFMAFTMDMDSMASRPECHIV